MAAADAGTSAPGRAGRRPPAAPRRSAVASALGGRLEPRLVLGADELDPDQVREGRVAKRPAALELAGEEARRRRGARRGAMLAALGRQGLDEHLSRRARRARCARRAGRPSRRSAPRRGSRGSAGSRRRRGSTLSVDLGEVVALGDHLGADEDAALGASLEAARISSVGAAPGGGVGVEPEDRQRRQPPRRAASSIRSVPAPCAREA